MDQTLIGLMEIVGPAILLVLLLWLVLRGRSSGKSGRTEQATDQLYDNEEERRREGTDDL
ncbi:MAG TPA: hypothetical protein VFZ35_03245 [Sphingomicrobium sp.]